jgi:hypothetical protein
MDQSKRRQQICLYTAEGAQAFRDSKGLVQECCSLHGHLTFARADQQYRDGDIEFIDKKKMRAKRAENPENGFKEWHVKTRYIFGHPLGESTWQLVRG